MRSPSPDCPPTGWAAGARDPRVVGAGVRVWGPCSVSSAGTPCGGCAPRGGSVAFMCWGAGWGGGGGRHGTLGRLYTRIRGRHKVVANDNVPVHFRLVKGTNQGSTLALVRSRHFFMVQEFHLKVDFGAASTHVLSIGDLQANRVRARLDTRCWEKPSPDETDLGFRVHQHTHQHFNPLAGYPESQIELSLAANQADG